MGTSMKKVLEWFNYFHATTPNFWFKDMLHKSTRGNQNDLHCSSVDIVVLLLTTFTGIHSNFSATRENLGGNLQNMVRSATEEAITRKGTSGLVCANFAICRSL